MLTHSPMHRIRIIVLKRDVDPVTEALGRLGVLELVSAPEETQVPADVAAGEQRAGRCRALAKRLDSLMQLLGVEAAAWAGREEPEPASLDEVEGLLAALDKEVAPQVEQLRQLDEKIRAAQGTMEEMAPYRELTVPPKELAAATFLRVMAGDMPEGQIAAARAELPADAMLVEVGSSTVKTATGGAAPLQRVLALSSGRGRFALQTILEEHQFIPKELPAEQDESPAAIYGDAQRERESLAVQRMSVKAALLEAGRRWEERLVRAHGNVQRELRVVGAQQQYSATWAAAIITGWCPAERVAQMEDAVRQAAGREAVCEARPATLEEIQRGLVPSHPHLPKWLGPFQRLVSAFGQASYREVEPTVLFAMSFLLMFGLIFGDLGHGVCLLAIAFLVWRHSAGQVGKDLAFIVGACGLSSVVLGTFFTGSFFGHSLREMGWRWTLDFEPLRLGAGAGAGDSAMRYMLLAVILGVALISLGLVLNILNRFRARDYEGMVLGRFGLAGIVFYWGALALVAKFAIAGAGPHDVWLGLLVGVPLVLLALHEPVSALLTGRRPLFREGPFVGLFESALTAQETVMAYVSNTFSFLRVAAFALSHAALCFTTFVLEDIVGRHLPLGHVWAVLVFMLGTVVIVGLEGLVVAIQVFRLEYYEFFTKFFRGDGHLFRPFRLNGGSL